jgi:radical SAM-linked protein
MESEQETLFIYLERGTRPEQIKAALNNTLPSGLKVIDCRLHSRLRSQDTTESAYQIRFSAPCIQQADIDRFLNLSEFTVEDLSKKGKIRRTDLRQSVQAITLVDSITLEMVLKQYNTRTIRPTEVLEKYFKIDKTALGTARIKKITQG